MNETIETDANGEGCSDELLPWYVNGTLAASERERVRRHLERCPRCRDELQLLSDIDSAVRHPAATPIVPPPCPKRLLAAIDRRQSRIRLLRRAAFTAAAAALAAVTFAVGFFVSGGDPASTVPVRFETLTSDTAPAASAAMDYVVEFSFESAAAAADRERVFTAVAASHVSPVPGGEAWHATLSVPAASLEELEALVRRLEALPEVRSARIVGVQLPVQRRP